MKNIIRTVAFVAFVSLFVSCNEDYIIGGDPNPTNRVNMTTLEYLKSVPETEGAAYLFEQAGMTELINSEVTLFAPGSWAINRYLRRKYNQDKLTTPDLSPYTIEDIATLVQRDEEEAGNSLSAEEALKKNMGLYVVKGLFSMDAIPDEGIFVTMENGNEAYLSVDAVEKDWAGDDDYLSHMETQPKLMHILYKRGSEWEFDPTVREAMSSGTLSHYDAPECDHHYRMWRSNVVTTTGVVNVLYVGELNYNSHYYYHCLFFFGTRAMDNQ